jgi:hypothetical protein
LSSRAEARVAIDPLDSEPEITDDDLALITQCDEMAAAIQTELTNNDSRFNLCSTQVYEYLAIIGSPKNRHLLCLFTPLHFSFLIEVFRCATLPMIIRSTLGTILSVLEFFDKELLPLLTMIPRAICYMQRRSRQDQGSLEKGGKRMGRFGELSSFQSVGHRGRGATEDPAEGCRPSGTWSHRPDWLL